MARLKDMENVLIIMRLLRRKFIQESGQIIWDMEKVSRCIKMVQGMMEIGN